MNIERITDDVFGQGTDTLPAEFIVMLMARYEFQPETMKKYLKLELGKSYPTVQVYNALIQCGLEIFGISEIQNSISMADIDRMYLEEEDELYDDEDDGSW